MKKTSAVAVRIQTVSSEPSRLRRASSTFAVVASVISDVLEKIEDTEDLLVFSPDRRMRAG